MNAIIKLAGAVYYRMWHWREIKGTEPRPWTYTMREWSLQNPRKRDVLLLAWLALNIVAALVLPRPVLAGLMGPLAFSWLLAGHLYWDTAGAYIKHADEFRADALRADVAETLDRLRGAGPVDPVDEANARTVRDHLTLNDAERRLVTMEAAHNPAHGRRVMVTCNNAPSEAHRASGLCVSPRRAFANAGYIGTCDVEPDRVHFPGPECNDTWRMA